MYIFTVILHVLVCFILIGVVLLQAGKGAEVGAAFGGSSQTLFGSRGAATFLSKVTIGAAVFYFVTSLTLTLLKKEHSIFPASLETSATSTQPKGTSTAATSTSMIPTSPETPVGTGTPLSSPTPAAEIPSLPPVSAGTPLESAQEAPVVPNTPAQ